MTPEEIFSGLSKANEKYGMFRIMTEDDSAEDAKFLFSADDSLTSVDMETCAGSRILEGYHPAFDATAIAKMRAAGGKLVGKTNMDEFGFGTFGVNSAYGIPRNPFDTSRVCGGASSGSACAAAVLEDHVSLAVSTGGSISNTASFCGIYGLSPSYGRVSRNGVIDHGASMDRVGLLSAKASDLRKYLQIIAGKDEREITSCVQPALTDEHVKLTSVAVPKEALRGISKGVADAFSSALDVLKGNGVQVELVDMPILNYTTAAYYELSASEACTNLARFVGMRYGKQDGDLSQKFDEYFTSVRTPYFGDEAKRRILLGTYLKMGDGRVRFGKACQVRQQLIDAYKGIMKDHDAVLAPTMPLTAPTVDQAKAMSAMDCYTADFLTAPACIAGMPCVSVPCGYDADGMPVGMQFVADHWQDNTVLSAAEDWEKEFEARRPEVVA